MRIRLIIEDKDYCQAFKDAISSSDKDIYVEIGKKGVINGLGKKTILVTDVNPKSVDKRLWQRTVFLTANADDSVDANNDEDCFKTFKYSPVSKILSEIEEVNFMLTGDSGKIYSANSRIYAICSDLCSKRFELAKTISRQIMFRRGGKILLISMKYINEYSEPNGSDNGKFTKLMYYLNCNRDFPIESYIYQDNYGISYLRIGVGINPVSKLESSEIITLIRTLCNRGFQTLILDIGDCYSDTNIELINKADNIVFFSGNQPDNFRIDDLIKDEKDITRLKEIKIRNSYQDLELEIDDYVRKAYGGNKTDGIAS